jgi:ribosome-associated protein
MEMQNRSTICNCFVVMSAPSTVRVKAIVDAIETKMEDEAGMRVFHKEGYADGMWVLMDYGDVIAHIFYGDTRRFYDLENLWGDVPKRSVLPSDAKS